MGLLIALWLQGNNFYLCRVSQTLWSDNLILLTLGFAGVYLTTCGPSKSPNEILKAIYNQQGQESLPLIEYVVEVEIPKNEVKKIHETSRPIYLYKGKLDLNNYSHKIYKRSSWFQTPLFVIVGVVSAVIAIVALLAKSNKQ